MQRQRDADYNTHNTIKTAISWGLSLHICADEEMDSRCTHSHKLCFTFPQIYCCPRRPWLWTSHSHCQPLFTRVSLSEISDGLSDSFNWRKCVSWSFHCPYRVQPHRHTHTHTVTATHAWAMNTSFLPSITWDWVNTLRSSVLINSSLRDLSYLEVCR